MADGRVTYQIGGDNSQFKKDVKETESIASKGFAGVKKVGKAAFAAVGAAAVAAGGALIAITKQAVDNFAEYEQLAGGAKLMFGDAYDYIIDKSKEAYKTVQMSQNDYLKAVNGFAVGLRESLGGAGMEHEAAELAARIVQAEADVVAATGATQEAVQNAFNGIMKGNFTMLDNLQLGITPTKEGLQDVIDKMNELNGTNYEMGNLADMQSAVLDYVDYIGMAGYAQKEALETIQGSLAATKAAWQNLLTGLADPEADVGELASSFIEMATTLTGKVVPVVEQVIGSLPQLLLGVTQGVTDILPEVLDAIMQILLEVPPLLASQLPVILSSLIESLQTNLPLLIDGILVMINQLLASLQVIGPQLIEMVGGLIAHIAESIGTYLPYMVKLAVGLVKELAVALADQLPVIMHAFIDLMVSLVDALPDILPALIDALMVLIEASINLWITSKELLIEAGLKFWAALIEVLPDLIAELLPAIVEVVVTMITSFVEAIFTNLPLVIDAIGQLIGAIVDVFFSPESEAMWDEVGSSIIDGIKTAITNGFGRIKDALKEGLSNAVQSVKNFLGIKSPSKVFMEIGAQTMAGMAIGIEKDQTVQEALQKSADKIIKSYDEALEEAKARMYRYTLDGNQLALQQETAFVSALGKAKAAAEDFAAEYIKDLNLSAEGIGAYSRAAQAALDGVVAAYDDVVKAQDAMAGNMAEYGDLIKRYDDGRVGVADLQDQISTIERYGAALEQIKARGAGQGLLAEIAGMSIEDAIGYTEALLRESDQGLERYFDLYEKKQQRAKEIAAEFYGDQIDALGDDYAEGLSDALGVLTDEATLSGMNTVDGLISGMESKTGELIDAAKNIADQVAETLRGAWEIHSPSKVFAQIGHYLDAGLAEGIYGSAMLPVYRAQEMAGQITESISTRPIQLDASGLSSRSDVRLVISTTGDFARLLSYDLDAASRLRGASLVVEGAR